MLRFARFAAGLILLRAVTSWAQLPTLETVFSGLNQPVFLTHAHDGSDRKFILEQPGRVLVAQAGASTTSVFLDIQARVLSGGEQGLLGLAFHPQYAANGRFFVNYTRRPDGATVIAEYHVSAVNPSAADASETVLLVIAQPFVNHNGGMIAFGPDNYLYIGMGDGGAGNDPGDRAQNVNDLLGKILRIDVDHPASATVRYSSPSSNPYFGPTTGRDEIYAIGLRNPWRFSFDRLNGQLYVGDVGQGSREEVDIVTVGGNYGWRVFEGTLCTGLGPASCASLPAVPPIAEYVNGQLGRCAVTGGYVYRGTRQSLAYGTYIFGDFCSGELFVFLGGTTSLLLDTSLNISSFGEDESGEIYVVNLGGSISRIVTSPFPAVTQRRFSISNRGAAFLTSNGSGSSGFATGYVEIEPDLGDSLPDGLAIFGWRQHGVLISEAAVPTSSLVQSGRIAAIVSGPVTTGIAIANPNAFPVNVDFNFTDDSGLDFGHGTTTIPENGQIAGFLNQSPFGGGGPIDGTFTFRTSGMVSAVAIHGFFNERLEFLMSALPIVPINATVLTGTIFPHWAQGGGCTTEFILVNPSDGQVNGVINLIDTAGQFVETLSYSIPPRSSRRVFPSITGSSLLSGSARMVATGGPLPSGVNLIRLSTSAGTVAETAFPAIAPGYSFRGYAEFSAAAKTGIAVTNATSTDIEVTIELRNLNGTLRSRVDIDLPGMGQKAFFPDELPGVDSSTPFQGVVRITSNELFAVTALRSRINERGDFLMTATVPVNTADPVFGSLLFFPHLAVGGGADMQFMLINTQGSGAESGDLRFFAPNGHALPLMVP